MWNPRIQRNLRIFATLLGSAVGGMLSLPAQTITWSEHIAPIVYENCTNCHRDGGVAPFSLVSYDDAKRRGQEISEVVESRFMPPWKPDPDYGPQLSGDRRLTDDQVELIVQWHEQGQKRGSSRRAPRPPKYPDSWTLGEPDLVLQLSEPYTLAAEGEDIHRNFVVPVPITEPRSVRAVEFLPQSQWAVHRAVMQWDESDGSRRRDAMDLEPGYGGMNAGKAIHSSGPFVAWSSGRSAFEMSEGTAWKLKPNTDLVVQLHLLPSGKPESVNPKIGLYYSDEATLKETDYFLLQADEIDIPAGEAAYVVEESLVVPVELSVLGIFPRAHYLAKDVQIFAELPDGDIQWLLRISDWDFHWLNDYRFEEALEIPAGSKLVMRYTFDNSAANVRNPNNPPKRVHRGYQTTDEVAEATIHLLLHDPSDRAAVRRAQTDYEIQRVGGVAEYAFGLGLEMEAQGRIQEAITAYERAFEEDPTHARACNRLGALFEAQGNKTQAEYYYREAIEADSSFHLARLNLGKFLRNANREQGAAKVLQEALEIDPSFLDARVELSLILVDQQLVRLAIQLFEDGLKIDPLEPYLNLQTAKLYVMDKKADASLRYFEAAAQGKEEHLRYDTSLKSILIEANWIPARMFEASGNLEKMNFYLDRIFELDPTYVQARTLLVNKLLESRQETEARRHLEVLLKLPEDQQPSPEALIAELSFPAGVLLLADIYKRTQRSKVGKDILEEALVVAKERGNRIWITQIQNDIARYR